MRMSLEGRRFTEGWEGRDGRPVLTAYLDSAGVPTIGFGHTKGVAIPMTCSPEQADLWMTEDLAEAENELNRLVTVTLNQNEFDALCDWEFNTGALGESTLLRVLNAARYEEVPGQMAEWCHARVHGEETVLAGLVRRRAAEGVLWMQQPTETSGIPVAPLKLSTASLNEGVTPMKPPQTVVATTTGKLQIGSLLSGGAAAVTAAVNQAQPAVMAVHQVQNLTFGLHGPVLYAVGAGVAASLGFTVWTLIHKHMAVRHGS
ncbi:MAG: hypothetical protein B7X03_03635 [Parcubacteria group bacterium 21-58-10]|nr:MAG: hypothetical protein B7X03_03635 [Parcubacteria group bacterium 21-58-10]